MSKTDVRTGLLWALGSMLGVIALGLTVFLIVDQNPPPGTAGVSADTTIVDGAGAEVPATTLTGQADTDGGRLAGGDSAASFAPAGEGEPLPPMGMATRNVQWTVTDLPVAPGTWFHQLVAYGDELWAIGSSYDEATEQESVVVLVSPDGLTWEERSLPEELAASGSLRLTATSAGMVAITERWEESGRSELGVFISTDGAEWRRAQVDELLPPDSHVWINGVAADGETIVMFGGAEPSPESFVEPTLVVEHDGKIVEVTPDGVWTITDGGGTVLATGSMDDVWEDIDQGPVVRGASGEILMRVDWTAFYRAATEAYAEAVVGQPLIIEYAADGLTLRLDEGAGQYTVTDESGGILAEGDPTDFRQGAPPSFKDPETGAEVLVVPWDVWNEAQELAYTSIPVRAEPVALVSVDGGAVWQAATVPTADGVGHVGAVTAGPAGFLAMGFLESARSIETPGGAFVWRSSDGITWSSLGGVGTDAWVSSLAATADGYLAAVGADAGAAIHFSEDGSDFQPILTDADLLLPLGSASLHLVAAGDSGLFAAGTRHGWSDAPTAPQRVEKGGRLLEIAYDLESTTYTVTEGGVELFSYVEQHGFAEEPVAQPPPVRWGEGGLAIFADDGTVVFAASSEEFERAMGEGEPEAWYIPEMVVVHDDGSGWAALPMLEGFTGNAFPSAMMSHMGGVALLATVEGPVEPSGEYGSRTSVLWGVPAG